MVPSAGQNASGWTESKQYVPATAVPLGTYGAAAFPMLPGAASLAYVAVARNSRLLMPVAGTA